MSAPEGSTTTGGPAADGGTRSPRRALPRITLVTVVAAGLVLWLGLATSVLGSLAAAVFESSVPSLGEGPSLPDDVTVVSTEEVCASGGCWVELTLRGAAGESPTELASRLELTEHEACHRSPRVWLWDVCTFAVPRSGALLVVLQYDPSD